ncbi:hypothetical protein R1flu_017170 [Riccia fluitans]|uniref:Uncharacterized protein n=1 Tax=Riccia fluitans TaxID=41844 RepID=A0ABD1XED3_9MARC
MRSTMVASPRKQGPTLLPVKEDLLHFDMVQYPVVPHLLLLRQRNVAAVLVLADGRKKLSAKCLSVVVCWVLVKPAGMGVVVQTLAATTRAVAAIIKSAIKVVTMELATGQNHLLGIANAPSAIHPSASDAFAYANIAI